MCEIKADVNLASCFDADLCLRKIRVRAFAAAPLADVLLTFSDGLTLIKKDADLLYDVLLMLLELYAPTMETYLFLFDDADAPLPPLMPLTSLFASSLPKYVSSCVCVYYS